jgi:hypothetical protein
MRKAFLLVALGWGAFVVLVVAVWALVEEDVGAAAIALAGGAILLIPLALPLLALRSRWYRIATLCCALVAACFYLALGLFLAPLFLLPSALIVLLSVLPPQPS